MNASPFLGRTIQVVRDLSVDEQAYLYDQTRLLKEALRERDVAAIDRFRVNRRDLGLYLVFLEDSTRTKESFRNAAKFHTMKLNDFSAIGSSFTKKESITDTVKMLVGYSEQSVFVLRTKLEGTCRWLEHAVGDYTRKAGLPPASFINGGDGRHEHPTQEFLDEFSFLEQKQWDRSHIHLALVGDLFHGRTVHSKVDGLHIFGEVEVDLV
ncbi:MAG TPA: bifunctional aspartate carbamoyltransferase catalytic subunit/aspartate carbamoyltransferase regulatory subunit, partial [Spirochaetia bacterium]|nr:bifunctional aspartate carbamoyltransferase catalytic subunit/aspartate carbamoyltransferase regulatory subunit [Spirochaetia bacterium]